MGPSNQRMSVMLIRIRIWTLERRKSMLFGHLTHEVPKEILMAWKEDRTRDRDLEILCVMETA